MIALGDYMKKTKIGNPKIDPGDWLGKDIKSWARSIRNGYVRAFILFALHETGVFDLLRKGRPITAKQIAAKCNLEPNILEGILNFLYHADRVLIKEDSKFSLSKYGHDWLFTDMVLTMSYGLVGAASCLLYELVPVLRGEKKYGVDFTRRGDLVAKGSYYTSSQNYPWIIDELKKLGVKVVADLGCGSAKILIDFCKIDPDIQGVGLDISSEALKEAQQNIKKEGLSKRIKLVEADITKPNTYSLNLNEVEAFNAIMVLHEFLRDGDTFVIGLLQKLKKNFPGRYCFVGELNPLTDREYQSIPYPDRIHMLCNQYITHQITAGKGLLMTKQQWLRLFKKADVEIIKVKDDFPFRLVEYVLRF